MSGRRKGWSIGLTVAAISWGLSQSNAATREFSIPLASLVLASTGLIAELFALRSLVRSADPARPFRDRRPADGVVDVARVLGVEALPNPFDATFRRFGTRADLADELPTIRDRSATNPKLLGRVALISVFVGRDGRGWTDAEVARGHEALKRAGLWIEREAVKRGLPVNIELADTYFEVENESEHAVEIGFQPEGDDFGPMESDASTRYLIDATRAASRLGFADFAAMIEAIEARIEADATVWLFHQKRAGRSLAIPASESDLPGVGLAICFAREASFPDRLLGPAVVDPLTVAHELFHLFGASDKYGVALKSYPPGQVTSLDIMRLRHNSLSRLRVDPLTAREVGWSSGSEVPFETNPPQPR